MFDRLVLALRNRRYRRRAAKRGRGTEIYPVRLVEGELRSKDLVLISVLKNAERYLPSFLSHYRTLGITRFAFVDDRSDDRTRELLLAAPDVDIYESNVNFDVAGGGLVWRDLLVERYGRDRWYMSLDCDEYLVFPGSEDRKLTDFIADLEREGRKRALAVMIDIYPDAALDGAPPHQPLEASPVTVCPLYDETGYAIENEKFCTAIRGGARQRMFGTDMRMTKFPLIYVDRRTRFNSGSAHGPLPIDRNFSPVHAALLHYKFSADSLAEFRTMYEWGTHFDGGRFYKQILDHAEFNAEIDFRYAGSTVFTGSEKLVTTGFIEDIRADCPREGAAIRA
ncbi:glycosyltransferase family 2 protein [Fulvimarina endophytica]|uniref:glycosyltransferase family 2 protein n=1 Tax=Fulvimarina endophytica TaxID=2293836 RepID=UPI001FDF2304|nr:glycosyltransferase family 2 protein [Fulvimarina endophytica]